jgi:adenylosuccinate lyase
MSGQAASELPSMASQIRTWLDVEVALANSQPGLGINPLEALRDIVR